jgi:hypothetical protein
MNRPDRFRGLLPEDELSRSAEPLDNRHDQPAVPQSARGRPSSRISHHVPCSLFLSLFSREERKGYEKEKAPEMPGLLPNSNVLPRTESRQEYLSPRQPIRRRQVRRAANHADRSSPDNAESSTVRR